MLAGIEAGGTKFVCALGNTRGDILKIARFPTTTPEETIQRSLGFFLEARRELSPRQGDIAALGIGSFGPVDLRKGSETYGFITSTAKPGWGNVDLAGRLAGELDVPAAFDTDVNAAALGEGRYGAARGLDNFLYITVGTGVGGGVVANGKPVHGMLHPELGHLLLPALPDDDFPGICPYHRGCVEGRCSGPALEKRWGMAPSRLPADHRAWDIEAAYLARALMAYVLILSPERIILGGGVMHQRQLFPVIRKELKTLLAGYVQHTNILSETGDYVLSPALEDEAGIRGALLLAAGVAPGTGEAGV